MDHFPVFLDLHGRACLVVGGGEVAQRKTRALLDAGAGVTLNAPALNAGLEALEAAGRIHVVRRAFDPALVAEHFLIVAATDDGQVNAEVYELAERANRLVNAVDDPAHCNYLTPAIVDRSPMIVAISSGGAAPVLARMLREQLERTLPATLGALATLARSFRAQVKRRLGTVRERRRFWESALTGPVARLVHAGRDNEAQARLATELESAGASHAGRGEVYIVGAGPGDPGLLTLRALQLMQKADIVLHDRLVSPEVLALVRRDAEVVSVGKTPGGHAETQDNINRLLVEHALAGRTVCRLKGGDPFVFGRGGEELLALREAGIGYEVVPGITAATGGAAYAGIPLTHRGVAQSVTFATAHCRGSVECLDWDALARAGQTLVFYMGVAQADNIRVKLIANGRAANTPVAIVQNATTGGQRVIRGELGQLGDLVAAHEVEPPALVIVGEVTRLAAELGWFAERVEAPLEPLSQVAA